MGTGYVVFWKLPSLQSNSCVDTSTIYIVKSIKNTNHVKMSKCNIKIRLSEKDQSMAEFAVQLKQRMAEKGFNLIYLLQLNVS